MEGAAVLDASATVEVNQRHTEAAASDGIVVPPVDPRIAARWMAAARDG